MPFITLSRYGAMKEHPDDAGIPAVVAELIAQLETEEFDEPDDEHVEIGVSYGDWGLSVEVSGLMALQDMREERPGDFTPAPDLYQWATDRSHAARLLERMARGEVAAVQADSGWVPKAQLPPHGPFTFRANEEADEEDEDDDEE